MTEENKEQKTNPTAKTVNKNVWRYTTIALLVIVVSLLAVFLWPNNKSITGNIIATSSDEVIANALSNFNKNILQGRANASLISIKEENDLYALKINISDAQNSDIYDTYLTKNGELLFLAQSAINLTLEPTSSTPPASQETPKTAKPTVQLYVMAFCPYGIQAEQAMKPVVDLLGSKADIQVHFIVSISGTTVNSLHGDYEAKEDMRQACIWKNYGQTTFWKYVTYINSNCNKNNLDTCWKDAAKNTSVDVSKIETCVTSEGLNLMKAEEALSNQNGVSGSPTLIINGVTYSGARTPDAYKEGICNAFTTKPSECSQNLSTTGSAASGGCAT